MRWRYYIDKAKKLEQKLQDLQGEIYSFTSEMEDINRDDWGDLSTSSGFELDEAKARMNELWKNIEEAYLQHPTHYKFLTRQHQDSIPVASHSCTATNK